MNINLDPLWKALAPVWKVAKDLFTEHNFLTLVCGFFVVMMTISFYKFLRAINPALVGLVLLIMLAILIMHWTVTRTEPGFMTPFINWLAPFFPSTALPTGPLPKPVRH
jgi:hypothetical protein